jgi:hypothetical protein
MFLLNIECDGDSVIQVWYRELARLIILLTLAIDVMFHLPFLVSINICMTVAIVFALHSLLKFPINVGLY